MRRRAAVIGAHCVLFVLCAVSVLAQGRAPAKAKAATIKGVIEIDGGYRPTSQTFVESSSPVINVEPARVSTTYQVPASVVFRGGGAVRLWKQFGAGMSISHFSTRGDAGISATIPNPFVFGHGREIQGTAGELSRQELGIGVQLRGFFPISPRLSISLFGGPEWISASGERVTGIDYTESYPYDTATFRSASTADWKLTKLVPSLGGDIGYFFSKQIGIGGGVRYAGGNIDIPSAAGGTVQSKVGGLDLGAGLRIRF